MAIFKANIDKHVRASQPRLAQWFLRFTACVGLAAITGCVGPVQDKVGDTFRANWIASRAKLATPYDDVTTAKDRNEFIDNFVTVKNIQYRNYIAALRRGSSYGNLTADGSRLVLDGLAATTGGTAVKAGLAAASAGITGFTGTFKKDVLFDQAIPSFVEKMDELRANKLADITLKKKLSIQEYTASDAYLDVEDYGSLGTFDSALKALNVQTGQATATAKTGLSVAKGDMISASASSSSPEQVEAIKKLVPRSHKNIEQGEMDRMQGDATRRKKDKPQITAFIALLDLIDGFTKATEEDKRQAYIEVVKTTIPTDPAKPVAPTPEALNFHYQKSSNQVERDDMRRVLLEQVNRLGANEKPPVSKQQ